MTMKKLILLLLPAMLIAQKTTGIVRDSLTGKPVQYASIWIQNEDISAMADSLGQFSVRTTNPDKTLVFSATGYETKSVRLAQSRNLLLTPISPTENTEKPKCTQKIEIGDYHIRNSDLTYGNHGRPWMLARKFILGPQQQSMRVLDKLELYTDCHNNNMKCALRFFAIDANGNPGRELTNKQVIFRVDRGRDDTEIDLSKYGIVVPEDGFFIAVSWLIIDQNIKRWYDKRPMQYKDYDPGIGAMASEVNSTWEYKFGKWAPMAKLPEDYAMRAYRGKYPEVAMKITLSN